MGKPKIAKIDDSLPKEEAKVEPKATKRGGDSLIESLKEELGIEEAPKPEERKSGKSEDKQSLPSDEGQQDTKAEEKPAVKKAAPKSKVKAPKSTRSKKYVAKVEEINAADEAEEKADFRTQNFKLNEAIELVKKGSYSKFDGTMEIHINTLSVGMRGHINLPFASGKKLRVAAFGNGAAESGADLVGDDKLLEEIKAGKINFDILITTAQWMPKLAPLARVLGPKGLMPNPKSGTITEDLKKTVESYQGGRTEYRTEAKAPVIHLGMGKLSQPTEELAANVKALLQTLGKSRVKKITLAPTMGPAVRLDLSSI